MWCNSISDTSAFDAVTTVAESNRPDPEVVTVPERILTVQASDITERANDVSSLSSASTERMSLPASDRFSKVKHNINFDDGSIEMFSINLQDNFNINVRYFQTLIINHEITLFVLFHSITPLS